MRGWSPGKDRLYVGQPFGKSSNQDIRINKNIHHNYLNLTIIACGPLRLVQSTISFNTRAWALSQTYLSNLFDITP
ncbi:hypothetical protein H9L39_11881 [Fusarium oxysporum f. sp. albedinis]|nr:hypothetical protein H9L39_11881 [Fusarium oxysporum f. sp. albedinis]